MDRHAAPTMTLSILTALLRLVAPSLRYKSTTIDDSLGSDCVASVISCPFSVLTASPPLVLVFSE
ncbi:hypothetical protein F2Q69_00040195 [Brassica cretica]|uniref:Secreted protein n=1 Tax=Brassica cretica TaxID=69181 RepID=A0A8S9NAU8_BRACR|nr:hypothetical protein F2Q69_00040195 [Brassica cretica]